MWNLIPALDSALLSAAQETPNLGGSTGPDLSRYFMVCAVLIVVTAGLAWGMRKLITGNLQQRAAKRSLQIVDVLGLGGKRKLAIVRCYDRTFVLGLGEREVTPVAELDPCIGADITTPEPAKSDAAAFAKALEKVRQAMPTPAVRTSALQPNPAKNPERVSPDPVSPVPINPAPIRSEQIAQPTSTPRKVVKKRRKVKVKRAKQRNVTQAEESRTREARAEDARFVASAALRIAEDKQRAKRAAGEVLVPAQPNQRAATQSQVAPVATARAETATPEPQSPSLRLEGIIG